MTYYNLTDLTPEQRQEIFRKEASKPLRGVTEDGRVVDIVREPVKTAPRTKPIKHPMFGLEEYRSDDPFVVSKVRNELGRDPSGPDEYRAALNGIAIEKGWLIEWVEEETVVEPEPVKEVKTVKRRGRPKGSKDKKPRKRRVKSDG